MLQKIELSTTELRELSKIAEAIHGTTLSTQARYVGENFEAVIFNRGESHKILMETVIEIIPKEDKDGD